MGMIQRNSESADIYILRNPFDHSIILAEMLRELNNVRVGDLLLFDDARSIEEFMINMLIINIVLEMNGPKEPKTDEELLDELISYTIDCKRVASNIECEKEVEEQVQELILGIGSRLRRELDRIDFEPRPIRLITNLDKIHLSMTEVSITFIRQDVYVRLEPVLYGTPLPNPDTCTEQDLEDILKSDDFKRNMLDDTEGVNEGQVDANDYYPHSVPEGMLDHYIELIEDFKMGYNDPRSLFYSTELGMLANSDQLGCSCGMHGEDCVASMIRYIAWELSCAVE